MERIIAGRFHTKEEADTVRAVMEGFVEPGDVCVFHNNPPGQHDALAMGGDESEDPEAKGADGSAAGGALAAGLAAGAVGALGGPVIALAAAGVGAYSGSLLGAVNGLGDNGNAETQARRPAGVMLSVRIASPAQERLVIHALRKGLASDIEQAAGTWADGDWTDFDPVAAPRLVGSAAS
jgi:hypothetical protein